APGERDELASRRETAHLLDAEREAVAAEAQCEERRDVRAARDRRGREDGVEPAAHPLRRRERGGPPPVVPRAPPPARRAPRQMRVRPSRVKPPPKRQMPSASSPARRSSACPS